MHTHTIRRQIFFAFIFVAKSFSLLASSFELEPWIQKAQKKITSQRFDNGLTVVHYPMTHTPEVFLKISYNVGSKDEDQLDQYGFAHILEHMMFKGTDNGEKSLSERDIDEIAEKFCVGRLGEGFNAYTSYDETAYLFHTDKNNWKVFLAILAEWMSHARLSQEHLDSEVKAVFQELKDRDGDSIVDLFKCIVPPDHPYYHFLIGTKSSIVGASSERLREFYHRYYQPHNATLFIVGNVTKQEALEAAKELFGNIQSDQSKEKSTPVPLSCYKDFYKKSLTVYKPIPNPSMILFWSVPGQKECSAYLNGTCVANLLSIRLHKKLKDDLHYVFSIGAGYPSFLLNSFFCISFEPKESACSIKKCKKLIMEELDDIAQNGFKGDEVDRLKAGERRSFLTIFEEPSAVTSELAETLCITGSLDNAFTSVFDIDRLQPSDLQNFVCTYLCPRRTHTIKYKPLPPEDKEQWIAHQTIMEEKDAALLATRERLGTLEKPSFSHKLPQPKLLDFSFENPDKELVLANGLRVFVKKRTTIPFITIQCQFYKTEHLSLQFTLQNKGAIPGIAMGLLATGSKGYTKKDHEDFFTEYGAAAYFNVSSHLTCLSSDFTTVGKRFVHILCNPTFPEEFFAEAIENSIEQLTFSKQRPQVQLHVLAYLHFYRDYPWTKSTDDSIEELATYSRDDLFSFHKQYVSPEHMFLTVVGNFDETTIEKQLNDLFSSWPVLATPSIEKVAIPDIKNPRPQQLQKYLPQELMRIGCGRITTTGDTKQWLALRLLESTLNKKLFEIREQSGIFYSAHGGLTHSNSALTKDLAIIITSVMRHNATKAQEEIKKVLASIARNGISQEDLTSAKHNYLTSLAKAFIENDQLCGSYAHLIAYEKPWDYYTKRLAMVKELSQEFVNNVAKEYLNPDEWSTITVGRIEQD